jgi:hypothetical protein
LETPKADNAELPIIKQGNTPSLTSTVFPDIYKLPATDPLRKYLPQPFTETAKIFNNNSRIKHEFVEVMGFLKIYNTKGNGRRISLSYRAETYVALSRSREKEQAPIRIDRKSRACYGQLSGLNKVCP